MPVNLTYPGVYVEEVPSGSRTVSGTSTSITAFIGRTKRGPVDKPVRLQTYGEYERVFGGLWRESTMSYAVQHYFLNGGRDAVIVRIENGTAKAKLKKKGADASSDKLKLKARTKGTGGNDLEVSIEHDAGDKNKFTLTIHEKDETDVKKICTVGDVKSALSKTKITVDGTESDARPDECAKQPLKGGKAGGSAKVELTCTIPATGALNLEAANPGAWGNNLRFRVDHEVEKDDHFNLTVYDGGTEATEEFRNLSVAGDSPRRMDQVLKNNSKLVRVTEAVPSKIPSAHGDPASGETIWTDDNASTKVGVDKADKGSDGSVLKDAQYTGSEAKKTGIYAFEKVDIFNIMCIPPVDDETDMDPDTLSKAAAYCKKRRAMLIIDPPNSWTDKSKAVSGFSGMNMADENAAIFFPRIIMADPLQENRPKKFAPCGAIAGVFARTDGNRGIWKAPAGVGAALKGVQGLSVTLTDGEHGQLNPLGVNCLRNFPVIGNVIYGARTCRGADKLASEFKYIPVRRTTLYIEESLYRGTQFAVFEPNDEPLWADIRFAATSFMQGLFRQGAFQGSTPAEAYFVKCDSETTTQDDINRGIVNIVVGFAPLKPAEFVVLKIQQISDSGAA